MSSPQLTLSVGRLGVILHYAFLPLVHPTTFISFRLLSCGDLNPCKKGESCYTNSLTWMQARGVIWPKAAYIRIHLYLIRPASLVVVSVSESIGFGQEIMPSNQDEIFDRNCHHYHRPDWIAWRRKLCAHVRLNGESEWVKVNKWKSHIYSHTSSKCISSHKSFPRPIFPPSHKGHTFRIHSYNSIWIVKQCLHVVRKFIVMNWLMSETNLESQTMM